MFPITTELYGSVDLKHHRYEVSYKKTKIGKDPVFVVKNRRIAQIDIDVEKRWNDGSGALRDAMKNALDIYNAQNTDASLELSMYLDFDDPAGTASGGLITRNAGDTGDTILVDGHNFEKDLRRLRSPEIGKICPDDVAGEPSE